MDNELPDSSAAPEGEEELAEKGYNIVDPDLNKSLGNVAMAKDRYTEKCIIIKVSLTEEVDYEEKGDLSVTTDQTALKVRRVGSHPSTRGQGGTLRTYVRVDRTKT